MCRLRNLPRHKDEGACGIDTTCTLKFHNISGREMLHVSWLFMDKLNE